MPYGYAAGFLVIDGWIRWMEGDGGGVASLSGPFVPRKRDD